MNHYTINDLKSKADETLVTASLDVQLQSVSLKTTKSGSPYAQVTFVDAGNQFSLKIWENKPQFHAFKEMEMGSLLRLSGDWTQNKYGIDAVSWDMRLLTVEEIHQFMAGDPVLFKKQQNDWDNILKCIERIFDPRLQRICNILIEKYGDRYRRSAAARKNHHARRGGLVEHVAQMMRTAKAVSTVYPKLNCDLLIAGVFFHDCGKMWENTYEETGFVQPYDLEGELAGHIPKGVELLNELWKEMMEEAEAAQWAELFPLSDTVRIHLVHLVLSHHGLHEYGSPTLPKTPEAFALHYIDNLDAKYEMLSMAYDSANELADGIYERQFPLSTNLIEPLTHFPKTTANRSSEEAHNPTVLKTEETEAKNTDDTKEDISSILLEEEMESKPFNGELF